MKKKLLAVVTGLLMVLGLSLALAPSASARPAPDGDPANYNYLELKVSNSILSDGNLTVCDTGGICQYPPPGWHVPTDPTFYPRLVAVAPYTNTLTRLVGPDGWASPWSSMNTGSSSAWINAQSLFDFYGCKRVTHVCTVQVISDRQ